MLSIHIPGRLCDLYCVLVTRHQRYYLKAINGASSNLPMPSFLFFVPSTEEARKTRERVGLASRKCARGRYFKTVCRSTRRTACMFKTHCYRLLRSLFWFYIENLGVYHESRLLTPKLGVSDRVRLHVVFVRTVRYYLQGSLHKHKH